MKKEYSVSILVGAIVAFAGSLLMYFLLLLDFVGPGSVANDNLMFGGTLLFISLYVFLLLGIFYSLFKTKKLNGNNLKFFHALKVGLSTSLSTAIVAVLLTFIFYEVIYPDYNSEMIEVITSKMESSDVSSAQITEKIEEQTQYYGTSKQAMFAFVGNLITGIAFTLLLSLFLRTKHIQQ